MLYLNFKISMLTKMLADCKMLGGALDKNDSIFHLVFVIAVGNPSDAVAGNFLHTY